MTDRVADEEKFARLNNAVKWSLKRCSSDDILRLQDQISSVGWQVSSDTLQMVFDYGELWCMLFDDKIVGTAGFLRHGADSAWIVLVTVRPEFRRRAIATKLMYQILDRSADYPVRLLDASNMGENVYRQIGFIDCGSVLFYELAPERVAPEAAVYQWQNMLFEHLPLPGTEKSNPALEFMYKKAPQHCRVLIQNDRIAGWFIVREKGDDLHIGPIYAETEEIALDAFRMACSMFPQHKLTLDIFDSEKSLLEAVKKAGGLFHHSHARQYYANFSVPPALCGMRSSAGPDFG